MSAKARFPWDKANAVAKSIFDELAPFCYKIQVVGSLRRLRPWVGDIELLYIPSFGVDRMDMMSRLFGPDGAAKVNLADKQLEVVLASKIIRKRLNSLGREVWGAQNKLAVHAASGIPVDLFATTPANWAMSLVVRTGGKQNNIDLAVAAKGRGLHLEPYGHGYAMRNGGYIHCGSEREVFEAVGLPYLEPKNRK